MNDNAGPIIVFIFSLFCLLFVIWVNNELWRMKAVEHGAAHYDTVTGRWQWNTKTK